jgi:alpha-tubulin suppressor-like RCC1 family protein
LWCWGDASFGSLGILYSSSPVGTPTQVEGGLAWVSFDTDAFHSCGVDTSGSLYCWGRNTEGQLGLGHTTDTSLPTRVGTETHWTHVATGRFHTCAASNDGRVACTGANDDGQLGVGDTARRNVPTFVNF